MPRSLQATAFLAAGLIGTAVAGADEIVMRTGGRIEGVIVDQTPTSVVVDTAPGRVTLPMSRVARVVRSRSTLDAWRERSASLDSGDVQGWASLARWAEQAGLGTQANEAWGRVLLSEPGNAEANRALGRTQVDGAWLPEDEAYRARGFVRFDGRWVSRAEHESLVRERAAEEAADQQRQEAGLRVREAEARAREAEARGPRGRGGELAAVRRGRHPVLVRLRGRRLLPLRARIRRLRRRSPRQRRPWAGVRSRRRSWAARRCRGQPPGPARGDGSPGQRPPSTGSLRPSPAGSQAPSRPAGAIAAPSARALTFARLSPTFLPRGEPADSGRRPLLEGWVCTSRGGRRRCSTS